MSFVEIRDKDGSLYLVNTDDIAVVVPDDEKWASGCYVTMRNGASRYQGFYLDGNESNKLKDFLLKI